MNQQLRPVLVIELVGQFVDLIIRQGTYRCSPIARQLWPWISAARNRVDTRGAWRVRVTGTETKTWSVRGEARWHSPHCKGGEDYEPGTDG